MAILLAFGGFLLCAAGFGCDVLRNFFFFFYIFIYIFVYFRRFAFHPFLLPFLFYFFHHGISDGGLSAGVVGVGRVVVVIAAVSAAADVDVASICFFLFFFFSFCSYCAFFFFFFGLGVRGKGMGGLRGGLCIGGAWCTGLLGLEGVHICRIYRMETQLSSWVLTALICPCLLVHTIITATINPQSH